MTATLLDFSQQPDLGLHAEIVGDIVNVAEPLGIKPLIVGAFARDLHMLYGYRIETLRQTEDIDFALAVSDWSEFGELQQQLMKTARFTVSSTTTHRMHHRNGLPVDLVPFGGIETRERKIAWPPRGEVVMDMFGFCEAHASACDVRFPSGVQARVVSLPGLALLKLVCWHDRHYQSPRKDAHDLLLILRNYLVSGNEGRLFDEFVNWTQEDDFDYQLAGARMLGHDMRVLLNDQGVKRVSDLLSEQADPVTPARLPSEMDPLNPDRMRGLLHAMLKGMLGTWRSQTV